VAPPDVQSGVDNTQRVGPSWGARFLT